MNEQYPTMTTTPEGHKEWRLNGQLHREDGPAVERVDGGKEWHFNGEPQPQPEDDTQMTTNPTTPATNPPPNPTDTLPGAAIHISRFCSTGFHSDHYGVGSMDLSGQRATQYRWLDIGKIYFSSPTPQQMLDAETAPSFTPGAKAFFNINRRLSFQQAELVKDLVLKTLSEAFKEGVPADHEIDQWRADHNCQQP